MPYNTGDFTQQGVAGYVNGGLLLNNKRDVTARISTDEESAGIDSVDIKIKDRLNDIEYHITGENLTEGENVIGGGGGNQYVIGKQTVTLSTDPVTLTGVADDLLDYEYIAIAVFASRFFEGVVISQQTPGHIIYYDFTISIAGIGDLSYRIDTSNMTLYSITQGALPISDVDIWACPVYM